MGTLVQSKSSSGITTVPIDSVHLSERRIFIIGDIDSEMALEFMKKVLYLNTEDSSSPISVFINSPGGEITSGMLMYDVIVGSKAPIKMFCTGRAYSMGAVLFACAGERYMLPNSELMIHQPLLGGRLNGNASSIKSISDSLLETKDRMNRILAKHTGQSVEEVDKQTAFDHYFTAQEAIDWGLADGIKSFDEMIFAGNPW